MVVDAPALLSGSFSKTVGGSTATSFLNQNGLTSGPNPQVGTLTHIGDGFGIAANASGPHVTEIDFLAFDLTLNLDNGSAETYQVTIVTDFSNSVDATGGDAFASSEFTLDDAGGEFFFTDLTSDTLYGDEKNGVDLPTSGALVEDSGTPSWVITLGPNESFSVFGEYVLKAGAFSSDFTADFSAALTVLTVVPEPTTILLLSVGGFFLLRKKPSTK